jgi:hypothetical protein
MIDDLGLEAVLCDAVTDFFALTKTAANPVTVRGDLVDAYLHFIPQVKADEAMRERVEVALKVRPDERWEDLLKWIIAREKEGQTLEKYAEWVNANPYAAPKVTQMAQRPWVIRDTWPAAFAAKKQEFYREAGDKGHGFYG